MRRTICGLAIIVIALSGAAYAATTNLPAVHYDDSCTYMSLMDGEASALLSLLGSLIDDMPSDVTEVDMEDGGGDGIPDYYELALLAHVLCAGEPTILSQYNNNKAVYGQLVDDLTYVVNTLVVETPRVDARLQTLANIIAAHDELMANADIAALQAMIVDLANQTADLLGDLDPDIMSQVNNILPTLKDDYSNVVAGIVGMSTEMQANVTGYINEYTSDIAGYVGQAEAAVTALQQIISSGVLSQAEVATVTADVTIINALIPAVNRTLNIANNIEIYGASKSASEPFSGAGDYDGDGTTNLAVYQANSSLSEFLPAVSGGDPYWTGNPALPVAGIFGLAALASAVGLGGVFSVRKK